MIIAMRKYEKIKVEEQDVSFNSLGYGGLLAVKSE
jgi:ATP adenylyltransferase/5',5'''-P-1,P-4-tetraphosphate phosphorylase II